jgi:hypothetical protein
MEQLARVGAIGRREPLQRQAYGLADMLEKSGGWGHTIGSSFGDLDNDGDRGPTAAQPRRPRRGVRENTPFSRTRGGL